MKFKKFILLTFVFVLTLMPVNIAMGTICVYNDTYQVYVTINEAYYCELDGDGYEDDIVSNFYLDVIKRNPFYPTKKFEFYLLVELYMPSGESYAYLFLVTCYPNVYTNPTLYFDNHATEPGWYTIMITAMLPYGPSTYIVGTEDYTFDPPGGSPPTAPPTLCRIEI